MVEDCHCSCKTAGDGYCSCNRSIICVLDLATPRFEIVVRQPQPLDCGKLLSKRSIRAYKSMIAAGQTDAASNAAARKRFADTSTEALHRSPEADHYCGAILQEQSSRSEVVPAAGRESHAADFFAVITPNASDEFDAVDLTGDYYHPQKSVDFGGWEECALADSAAQARSPENGTRVQGVGDVRKEKVSLWTRVKKYISRRLCCQQR